ncbi:hypothetical protein HKX69_29910 [Streptomyces argyrophyllae]|uniref:Uncharacterized protein n=1 Tax=Streptomyces argyrophylli TaxID=2726118 RepID=A0A6M4PRE7_9ACTN|nr:hypothetical protein [Streptomyces argyrophyllae]QJS13194.1 hypothetical protein HKX69_29910 [Streptomyces argyrophyllae]
MSTPRTVTLTTADRGPVTIPEPAWCQGHAHHDPHTEYVDITHSSPDIALNFRHTVLLTAGLVQAPHGTSPAEGMDGPTPGVSVFPLGDTLGPAQLYDLAGRLDAFTDQLRGLADQLTAILGGEGR